MYYISQKALALLVSGLFVCLMLPIAIQAQSTLRFTGPAMQVHQQVTRMEFTTAREAIRRISKNDPHNVVVDFLQFEMDFLASLTAEESMVLDRFQRLAQGRIDRIRNVPETEVWRHFCLGEMYMMRGVMAARRQSYLQAAADIRKGYQSTHAGLKRFLKLLPCRRA